jgi:hypothetical protein
LFPSERLRQHSSTQPTEKRFVLLKKNAKMMKITYSNPAPDEEDNLAAEYAFDYTKAKPDRFSAPDSSSKMTVIVLDKDIAQAFPTSEAVNQALRQLIQT